MLNAEKICSACKKEVPLTNFVRNKKSRDGLYHKCKDCSRNYSAARYAANPKRILEAGRIYRLLNREKVAEQQRTWRLGQKEIRAARQIQYRLDHPELVAEQQRRSRQKYPEKREARLRVQVAIRNGTLLRQPCEKCGITDVEAHHDNYAAPLEVRWLCSAHHAEHHRIERVRQMNAAEGKL